MSSWRLVFAVCLGVPLAVGAGCGGSSKSDNSLLGPNGGAGAAERRRAVLGQTPAARTTRANRLTRAQASGVGTAGADASGGSGAEPPARDASAGGLDAGLDASLDATTNDASLDAGGDAMDGAVDCTPSDAPVSSDPCLGTTPACDPLAACLDSDGGWLERCLGIAGGYRSERRWAHRRMPRSGAARRRPAKARRVRAIRLDGLRHARQRVQRGRRLLAGFGPTLTRERPARGRSAAESDRKLPIGLHARLRLQRAFGRRSFRRKVPEERVHAHARSRADFARRRSRPWSRHTSFIVCACTSCAVMSCRTLWSRRFARALSSSPRARARIGRTGEIRGQHLRLESVERVRQERARLPLRALRSHLGL